MKVQPFSSLLLGLGPRTSLLAAATPLFPAGSRGMLQWWGGCREGLSVAAWSLLGTFGRAVAAASIPLRPLQCPNPKTSRWDRCCFLHI